MGKVLGGVLLVSPEVISDTRANAFPVPPRFAGKCGFGVFNAPLAAARDRPFFVGLFK